MYRAYKKNNHQIFYGAMSDKSLPIGISRIRDRVVLNRMSSLSQQPPKPWNLWLWDPVSFRRDTWYQLFYVIRFNRTNVYMYDMAGKQSCELNYFHAPNISNVKDWGFGSHDGVTSTNFRLDDIKISIPESSNDEEIKYYEIFLFNDSIHFCHYFFTCRKNAYQRYFVR
jgi:hypothetical protein